MAAARIEQVYIVLFGISGVLLTLASPQSSYHEDYGYKCQPLEFCKTILPYNQTIFPNLLGHRNQVEAQTSLNDFEILINTQCSENLRQFLCLVHASPCTLLSEPIPACRSACEVGVTQKCRDILKEFKVTSRILQCSNYPVTELCLEANNTISNQGSTDRTTTYSRTYPNRRQYEDEIFDSSEEDASPVGIFILVTNVNKIQLMDIQTQNSVDTITLYKRLGDIHSKTAIDYFRPEDYIYWASNIEGKIYRGKQVMDSMTEVRPIIDISSSTVDSLAVDWHLCVLFWIEVLPMPAIKTSSLSGRQVTTVVSRDLLFPTSLTLDPTEGKLFWISKGGDIFRSFGTIESYSIVEEKRRRIINITETTIPGGGRPTAVVADISGKRLYWVDSRSRSLHSINYDGTDLKTLLVDHELLNDPESIAIHDDHVIWTDKSRSTLNWANKHTGKGEMTIKRFDAYLPEQVKIYDRKYQNSSTPSYDKSVLSAKWKELSSSENMADYDHEYDDDEYDDDYYDEDYDRPKRKRKNKKTGSGSSKPEVIYVLQFIVYILCLFL